MNPWLIALACLLGAGFIAGYAAFRRIWWPIIALTALIAVISLQLYFAYRGQSGYHDLAALRAMQFTTIPALAGIALGILIGERMGQGLNWRSWQGGVMVVGLAVASGAILGAWLV